MGPFFEETLRALASTGVRHVVVGGLAVVLQGHARLTVDLDIVTDLAPDAALKVVTVLCEELSLRPTVPVEAAGFADPVLRGQWTRDKGMLVFSLVDPADPLRRVDLFTESPFPFDEMYARADDIDIGGVTVKVASLDDLIDMKVGAGRPKDLADVEVLRVLRDERSR